MATLFEGLGIRKSTSSTIEGRATLNQDGTIYMVVSDLGITPTPTQVKNGQDGNGDPVPPGQFASTLATASVEIPLGSLVCTGLTEGLGYDVYIVGEGDIDGLMGATPEVYAAQPKDIVVGSLISWVGEAFIPYYINIDKTTNQQFASFIEYGYSDYFDAIAYNSNDGFMYMTRSVFYTGELYKFDLSTGEVILVNDNLSSGVPIDMTYNSNDGYLYVFDDFGDIFVYDTDGNQISFYSFTDPIITFINDDLYGASPISFSIKRYNKSTGALLETIPVIFAAGYHIQGLHYDASSGNLYGSLWEDFPNTEGILVIIDPDTGIATQVGSAGQRYAPMTSVLGPSAPPSVLTQDYNLIHDVETEYENTTTQPNNIDVTNNPGNTDPQFKTPGLDFSLLDSSPAISSAAGTELHPDIPTDDIIGNTRFSDIGAYEFVPVDTGLPPIPVPSEPVFEPDCEEPDRERLNLWDYVTSFFDHLTDEDREMFENYWGGLYDTSDNLTEKAARFYEAIDPENARVCIFDDFYDLQIGPLYSRPMNLDPTTKEPINTIRPLSLKLIEPNYDDGEPVYRDLIELSNVDYYRVRNVGIDAYVVVTPKRDDIATKYFKVFNLLSSEEPVDRFSYAEIDESLNDAGEDPDVGTIAIQATQAGVESYTVHVIEDVATSVEWDNTPGSESLVIKVNAGEGISEVFAALPGTGTPWATLINKSGFNEETGLPKAKMPIFGAFPVEMDDLPNFIYEESANDRHYPPTGLTWKWFPGYPATGYEDKTPVTGEYVQSPSKFRYMMVVDGDLSYLKDESFTIHLTTARSYDIHDYILEVPELQSFINSDNPPEFKVNRDFSFKNHIVEFKEDIFETGEYKNGDYLYVKKAKRIEDYLFDLYGTLTDNSNWLNFNYDNYSGKAAVNALMKSLQNSSNREDYERALNVYYGLPVAPENCEVVGLYESYGYEVLDINGNQILIGLADGEPLHPFVQEQTRFLVEKKKDVTATFIIDRLTTFEGRSAANINLSDASYLSVGDKLYTKLRNKFYIKRIIKEGDMAVDDPAYIEIFSPEGAGAISHIIDVINTLSSEQIYPEILIYGTEKLEHNYNGIYHITEAVEMSPNVTRLSVYKASESENPIYNDYIGVTTPLDPAQNIKAGFVHIPWPTHKFLYLLLNGEKYHRAYLDSPIDTIYDEEDILEKYQVVARNVSSLNDKFFPDWNQFDRFKRYNGIDLNTSILELVKAIPGAKFGEYFPSRYQ